MPNLPLIIYRRQVRPNLINRIRNAKTIQSALIRGDVEITLNNMDRLDQRLIDGLRMNHNDRLPLADNYEPPFRFFAGQHSGAPRQLLEEEAMYMFGGRLWNGVQFEFVKILGEGGFGAATLWDVHFEGGMYQRVVIKVGISEEFDPAEELWWHERYHGNRHVVQLVDVNHVARWARAEYLRENPNGGLSWPGEDEFDVDLLNGIILEYMKYGDLSGILKKASQRRQFFPNRVLWGLWECLILGLAAVAYQPHFTRMNLIFEDMLERAHQLDRFEDFLEVLEGAEVSHDVHLDLEETNILVGESEDHPNQPIFKIHDLGSWSQPMRENWETWDNYEYWRIRGPPKIVRVAPESVHKDWDSLDTNDENVRLGFIGDDLTQGNPIAGRFGSWTNVFLAARTMEAASTLMYIAHPFKAEDYTALDGTTAQTYGWRLNRDKYKEVDPQLRDILCKCMFEKPADRPDVIALLRHLEQRKQTGFSETDEDVKRFWDDFFNPEPVLPTDPAPVNQDDSWDQFARSFRRKQKLRAEPPPRKSKWTRRMTTPKQPTRRRKAWLRRMRVGRQDPKAQREAQAQPDNQQHGLLRAWKPRPRMPPAPAERLSESGNHGEPPRAPIPDASLPNLEDLSLDRQQPRRPGHRPGPSGESSVPPPWGFGRHEPQPLDADLVSPWGFTQRAPKPSGANVPNVQPNERTYIPYRPPQGHELERQEVQDSPPRLPSVRPFSTLVETTADRVQRELMQNPRPLPPTPNRALRQAQNPLPETPDQGRRWNPNPQSLTPTPRQGQYRPTGQANQQGRRQNDISESRGVRPQGAYMRQLQAVVANGKGAQKRRFPTEEEQTVSSSFRGGKIDRGKRRKVTAEETEEEPPSPSSQLLEESIRYQTPEPAGISPLCDTNPSVRPDCRVKTTNGSRRDGRVGIDKSAKHSPTEKKHQLELKRRQGPLSMIEQRIAQNRNPVPVAIQNMVARTHQLDRALQQQEDEESSDDEN